MPTTGDQEAAGHDRNCNKEENRPCQHDISFLDSETSKPEEYHFVVIRSSCLRPTRSAAAAVAETGNLLSRPNDWGDRSSAAGNSCEIETKEGTPVALDSNHFVVNMRLPGRILAEDWSRVCARRALIEK